MVVDFYYSDLRLCTGLASAARMARKLTVTSVIMSAQSPPYVVGLVAGMASGAAMLPYTVIKEANPPDASGTATGVVNFLNFTFSALLTPVFGWIMLRVSGGLPEMQLEHYQTTFTPLPFGVGLAILLTFFLRETGPAIRQPNVTTRGSHGSNTWNGKVRSAAR